jgi:hypothetical protein
VRLRHGRAMTLFVFVLDPAAPTRRVAAGQQQDQLLSGAHAAHLLSRARKCVARARLRALAGYLFVRRDRALLLVPRSPR